MNFEYIQAPVPDDCRFKISPSQIANFFSYPTIWFQEQILGDKKFTGSTATNLGTIVHAYAEEYANGREVSEPEIEKFISSLGSDIDKDEIRDNYSIMGEMLISEYLQSNMPTKVEYQTCGKVSNGIYISGSVDARQGTILIDYKTAGVKPKTEKIPFNYFIQLMAYAFVDKKNGIDTTTLRIVYIIKQTKTLPVRVFVVNHRITDDDWKMAKQTFNLIAETVNHFAANPNHAHLLFKSYKLKYSNYNKVAKQLLEPCESNGEYDDF